MNRNLLIAAACLAAATAISSAHDAFAQQLVTPPSDYVDQLLTAQHGPFFLYVAGVASGANAAWIAATGEPLFCHPHDVDDIETTRQVILDYLRSQPTVTEEFILEAVVPAAFAAAYPCGVAL